MRISFADSRPAGTQSLALTVAPGGLTGAALAVLPAATQEIARRAANGNRFDGEAGALVEIFGESDGGLRRILIVGIGTKNDYERAGAAVAARLLTSGETSVIFDLASLGAATVADAAAAIAFGATLRSWRHDIYRTKLPAKQRPSLEEVVIVGGGAGAADAWAIRSAVAEGVMFTRELVSEPANILYPESFVERCLHLKEHGVEIEILDTAAMAALGMGALLGVAQGSVREPRLLVMKWNGGGDRDPVALVGKGVTFDTGGISLKPPAGMEDMKWDMGGAGAVAGAMKAIALRKAKAMSSASAASSRICPTATPSGPATSSPPCPARRSRSSTPMPRAAGAVRRDLVGAEALHPKTIVDLATLTGAMIVSLGHEYGGIFSNDDASPISCSRPARRSATSSGGCRWAIPTTS
jgi:leucyl aminopeptidase